MAVISGLLQNIFLARRMHKYYENKKQRYKTIPNLVARRQCEKTMAKIYDIKTGKRIDPDFEKREATPPHLQVPVAKASEYAKAFQAAAGYILQKDVMEVLAMNSNMRMNYATHFADAILSQVHRQNTSCDTLRETATSVYLKALNKAENYLGENASEHTIRRMWDRNIKDAIEQMANMASRVPPALPKFEPGTP